MKGGRPPTWSRSAPILAEEATLAGAADVDRLLRADWWIRPQVDLRLLWSFAGRLRASTELKAGRTKAAPRQGLTQTLAVRVVGDGWLAGRCWDVGKGFVCNRASRCWSLSSLMP